VKTITNICIVDDSDTFSKWLESDLSVFDELNVSGKVSTVENAKEFLKSNNPDIIILDLRLTDGSGFDILDHLQSKTEKPIVYVLSSYNLTSIREKCIELGADGFYDKSSDYFSLIERIRTFNKEAN
jgi:DNA-binding NarL/FixJ family response regulator